MRKRNLLRLLFVGALVVVLLIVLAVVDRPAKPGSGNLVYSLEAPAFLTVSRADDTSILSVIGDEAGISAYFQAATAIDLNNVRDVFRTIEAETPEYILGSVAVLNYPESEDVHVYVHTSGWVLAYYLAADPVGKIYDWRAYRDSGETDLTTKLENTLSLVADYAIVAYPGCTYYDFRYPNATHLTLIGEWVYNATDFFEVQLPGTFTYYERSWSIGYTHSGILWLDGTQLYTLNPQTWGTDQGVLTAGQLLPDQFHTVEINGFRYAYAGLALVYRVP